MEKYFAAVIIAILSFIADHQVSHSWEQYSYEVEGHDVVTNKHVYGYAVQKSETSIDAALEYDNGTVVNTQGEFCGMGMMRLFANNKCFFVEVVE